MKGGVGSYCRAETGKALSTAEQQGRQDRGDTYRRLPACPVQQRDKTGRIISTNTFKHSSFLIILPFIILPNLYIRSAV